MLRVDRPDRRTLLRIRLRDVGLESNDRRILAEMVNDRFGHELSIAVGTSSKAQCRASQAPHSVTAEPLFGDRSTRA